MKLTQAGFIGYHTSYIQTYNNMKSVGERSEKEDIMNGIILAVIIIAVCKAVKVIIKRELKKYRNTNDNNFKGAVGA